MGSLGLDSILLTGGSRTDLELISLIIVVWQATIFESREGDGDRLSAPLTGVVACFRIYEFDRR